MPASATTIGELVHDRRMELGLSQDHLGVLAGLSRGTVRNIEGNQGKPTNRTIRFILTALALDPTDAAASREPAAATELMPASIASRLATAVLDAYWRGDKSAISLYMDFMRTRMYPPESVGVKAKRHVLTRLGELAERYFDPADPIYLEIRDMLEDQPEQPTLFSGSFLPDRPPHRGPQITRSTRLSVDLSDDGYISLVDRQDVPDRVYLDMKLPLPAGLVDVEGVSAGDLESAANYLIDMAMGFLVSRANIQARKRRWEVRRRYRRDAPLPKSLLMVVEAAGKEAAQNQLHTGWQIFDKDRLIERGWPTDHKGNPVEGAEVEAEAIAQAWPELEDDCDQLIDRIQEVERWWEQKGRTLHDERMRDLFQRFGQSSDEGE